MSQTDTAARPDDKIDIRFIDVSKHYGEIKAVDRVSFAIARGSFHSFLGPSGCGKTTSLRLIAGFEQPTMGEVLIAEASVVGVPAYRRPVNMVFQHYALFPHLDVAGNVAYGLRQRRPRPERSDIDRQVAEALELVRLPGFSQRRIWELSGGQQQRVALARALINRPTVLLLDEPLAALDRKLRREMQIELQNLQREVGITFVLVTHDQEEALSMSDTISIMREGRIVQTAGPRDLYEAPVNRYVADFVGETNFYSGEVLECSQAGITIRTALGVLMSAPRLPGAPQVGAEARWVVALRPEVTGIRGRPVVQGKDLTANWDIAVPGRVINRIYLGDQTEFNVMTDQLGQVLVRVPKNAAAAVGLGPGDAVEVGWQQNAALALTDT